MIRMRKEVPEIGWGDFTVLRVARRNVLALRYDWRNNSVVILHNLSGEPREFWVDVGLQAEEGSLLVNLLSGNTALPKSQRATASYSKATAIVGFASVACATFSTAAIREAYSHRKILAEIVVQITNSSTNAVTSPMWADHASPIQIPCSSDTT